MKILLIFLVFFSLFGCNGIGKNIKKSQNFTCPKVFFSSEDRIFIDTIDGGSSVDDVTFKAEINNFALNDNCVVHNTVAIIPLDILIVAQPLDNIKNQNISMPLYAILLDQNDQVLETQYFMVAKSIKQNFENKKFIETDITDKLQIVSKNLETTQIIIGFMLDNKKRLLVN
tara:strand:+ start:6865 stop:7380 length:516 start_codon:yes stop_codon:yes gene_type:complete